MKHLTRGPSTVRWVTTADHLRVLFRSMADDRAGAVHALEHGLTPDGVAELQEIARALLRSQPEALWARPLPLLVLCAEAGYAFEGLWKGYWPHLEATLGIALNTADRERITDAFVRASMTLNFKRPAESAFSRTYRHITWPITHAIAPRQLHEPLGAALREVALLGGLATHEALARAVEGAARRAGAFRLAEWCTAEPLAGTLANALLTDARDGLPLAGAVIDRIFSDIMERPGAAASIRRARIIHSAAPPRPAARLMLDGDELWLVAGGERGPADEGLKRLLTHLDAWVSVAAEAGFADPPVRETVLFQPLATGAGDWEWRAGDISPALSLMHALAVEPLGMEEGVRLLGEVAGAWLYEIDGSQAAGRAFLDAQGVERVHGPSVRGGLCLDLGRTFATGVPLVARPAAPDAPWRRFDGAQAGPIEIDDEPTGLVFADVEPAPPAIVVRADPADPTLADLSQGRLSLIVEVPRALTVPIRATLHVPGRVGVEAQAQVTGPARLSCRDPVLAPLAGAADEMPAGIAGRLVIDFAIDQVVIPLPAPRATLEWRHEDRGWVPWTIPSEGEPPEPRCDVVVFDAEAPLVPAPFEANTFRLIRVRGPDGLGAGLVIGPTLLRPLSQPAVGEQAHRKLRTHGPAAGVLREIEAMIDWHCASATTVLCAGVARQTARACERAVVRTLCGEVWLAREDRSAIGHPFAVRLARAAIGRNLVSSDAIDCDDPSSALSDLEAHLSRHLGAFGPLDLAHLERSGQASESDAEALDEAVSSAWEALDDDRAANGLPRFDVDPGASAEQWTEAIGAARDAGRAAPLLGLIAPEALREALAATGDPTVSASTLVAAIHAARIDLGTQRRQARRLDAEALSDALTLWIQPAAARLMDWPVLAEALLEDRMTARALRYAALWLWPKGNANQWSLV